VPGAHWAAWGQGFGNSMAADGDGNAAAYSGSLGGFLAGLEASEHGAWRIGAAVGYTGSSLSVPDRASSATISAYHAAVYGGLEAEAWSLRVGGAVASGTIDTVRGDTFSGFSQTLTASYGATVGQVFGEAAYRAQIGGLAIEPFANIAGVHVATDAFSESGGSAALSADAQSQSVTFTSLGARVAALLPFGGSTLRLSASAAWQHTIGNVTPTANLAFSGGTPFTVAGTPLVRDALKLQADADWKIGKDTTVGLGYSGVVASGMHDHALTARIAIHF
jgi:outer membrane autotransporter protein